MAAVPILRRQLIGGQDFQLICLAVPAIEVISAPSLGKDIDTEIQYMARRQDYLKVRQGRDASRLDLISGKRQTTHRLSAQFVRNFLREIQLVFNERACKLKSRRPVGQPHDVAVLSTE